MPSKSQLEQGLLLTEAPESGNKSKLTAKVVLGAAFAAVTVGAFVFAS